MDCGDTFIASGLRELTACVMFLQFAHTDVSIPARMETGHTIDLIAYLLSQAHSKSFGVAEFMHCSNTLVTLSIGKCAACMIASQRCNTYIAPEPRLDGRDTKYIGTNLLSDSGAA